MNAPVPVEHFFRHEYAKLVASLSRRVGVQHLAAAEDAAQSALMTALERWKVSGPPDNASAWLFRVAYNELLGELRRGAGQRRILEQHASGEVATGAAAPEAVLTGEVKDDLLRMLFVCCDDAVPVPSQLALALKTLCGFSVPEIAARLFASEAHVYKRLARARASLRERPPSFDALDSEQVVSRLPAVQRVLYLLFTEGHLSSHAERAIREELCGEAMRLGLMLAEHPAGETPETSALLALMHLHAARMATRRDATGGLLLLEEQDRSAWDRSLIEQGLAWLARSASGDVYSRYHAEAGIAAEHCLAPSFAETRWERVVEAYEILDRVAPSPVHKLNRAVALAELHGPERALAELEGFEPPTWLSGSHFWSAVLADLHRRAGHDPLARRYRELALAAAPTAAVRELLERRLANS